MKSTVVNLRTISDKFYTSDALYQRTITLQCRNSCCEPLLKYATSTPLFSQLFYIQITLNRNPQYLTFLHHFEMVY